MKRAREDNVNDPNSNAFSNMSTTETEQKLRRIGEERVETSLRTESLPSVATSTPFLLQSVAGTIQHVQMDSMPFSVRSPPISMSPHAFMSGTQMLSSYPTSPPTLSTPIQSIQQLQPPIMQQQMSMLVPPAPPVPSVSAVPTVTAGGLPTPASNATAPSVPHRQVKFENALDFLDQVKLQFANQPKVYNQFLDIMKDFKAQCIDTPGVIARVSELFKGHKSLILGFNTFLPPGYKIEHIPDDPPVAAPISPPPVMPSQPTIQQITQPVQNASATSAANAQRKQPEFDHARNYVKKIKMRFAMQPQIYKSFLEILHTYHKEQLTIKEVYDQVATLFATHSDLLDEFTQFLPDPVAAQPPPSLNANQQQRQKKKTQPPQLTQLKLPPKPTERALLSAPQPVKKQPPRKRADRPQTIEEKLAPNGSYEELNFFYRVKQRLNNQQLYFEFLKCLNLFSQGIITRIELVLLAKDLLSKHKDLFDWFKRFIGLDDPTLADYLERSQEDKMSYKPAPSEIDFKNCKRYGPSYRALPKNYESPICSGRTELCNEVLNDTWVSVPTGSEDFGFKNMRKNQYEEMLFKCEDDRFELDLVIELNATTISILDPLIKSFSETSEDEHFRLKLETSLDILQLRSIERIYGDKGPEVIDALFTNPVVTIPVVLKRLKQKDQEWIRARREWNRIWREVNEKNYYKSLDHQSFYFKQNDKKNLSPKVLVAEIKQQYQETLKERINTENSQRSYSNPGDNLVVDDTEGKTKDHQHENLKEDKMEIELGDNNHVNGSSIQFTKIGTPGSPSVHPAYHLKYQLQDTNILADIIDLVMYCADKTLAKLDKEKIDTFFKHFVKIFCYMDSVPKISGGEEPTHMEVDANHSTVNSKTEDKTDESTPSKSKSKEDLDNKREYQLLFGNTAFYVFFRLIQVLYDRLAIAKDLSKKQASNNFAYLLNPVKGSKPEDEADKYKQFFKLVYSLIAAAKEQTLYEDECRALFGIQSYILFTLDKVVIQLTKQIQMLLSEEVCSKLLALYSFECTRTNGKKESLYHSSVVDLLEDERCFKFEFEKSPNIGELSIKLLDFQHNPPQFLDFSPDKHEKWSQYVERFMSSDVSNLDIRKHKIYLLRNLNKTKHKDLEAALADVELDNGLECRISLSNFRLFFVESTEDYMYRVGKLRNSYQNGMKSLLSAKQKQKRLEDIIQQKFGSKLDSSELSK